MKKEERKTQARTGTKPEPISIDPMGSYTGRPEDPYEKPVQDADDL